MQVAALVLARHELHAGRRRADRGGYGGVDEGIGAERLDQLDVRGEAAAARRTDPDVLGADADEAVRRPVKPI